MVNKHPVVFDAAAFYGHNECQCLSPILKGWLNIVVDIKNMTVPRYKLGRDYMDAYEKHFSFSDPQADRDDRLALYSLRRFLSFRFL